MSTRRKMVFLPASKIWKFFQQQQRDNIIIPIFNGLPKDATLIDVFYDPMRDCFCLKIEHPSFEEIPVGQCYPSLNVSFEVKGIKL